MAEIIEQEPPLEPIHVWEDGAGEKWACVAHDHGPMCRLCQPVDGTLEACLQNVMDGLFVAKAGPGGEFQFKTTGEGYRRAGRLIGDITGEAPDA